MSSSTPLTKEHGSTCFENASKYFDSTHIGNHWLWRLKQKAGKKRQCKWLKVADSGCEVRHYRIFQWSGCGVWGKQESRMIPGIPAWETWRMQLPHPETKAVNRYDYIIFSRVITMRLLGRPLVTKILLHQYLVTGNIGALLIMTNGF